MLGWLFKKKEKPTVSVYSMKDSVMDIHISCDLEGDFSVEIDLGNFDPEAMQMVGTVMHHLATGKFTPVFLEVYKSMAEENLAQADGIGELVKAWEEAKKEELHQPAIDPFKVFNITSGD